MSKWLLVFYIHAAGFPVQELPTVELFPSMESCQDEGKGVLDKARTTYPMTFDCQEKFER